METIKTSHQVFWWLATDTEISERILDWPIEQHDWVCINDPEFGAEAIAFLNS
jgi:hypothetical protein